MTRLEVRRRAPRRDLVRQPAPTQRADLTWPQLPAAAEAGRQILTDHPGAEYHALPTGHFALEDKAAEIAALMRDFLARVVPRA